MSWEFPQETSASSTHRSRGGRPGELWLPCHLPVLRLLCVSLLLTQTLSRTPAITYQHIFEDHNVSVGIFSLAKGAQLPLHNHPGMTVLSR